MIGAAPFRLHVRMPGSPVAVLIHRTRGRHTWKLSRLEERHGRKKGAPRHCGLCDRPLAPGDAAWRPVQTTDYDVRLIRICPPCVDAMAVTP